MAAQITCDMCEAEPATVMQSNLSNGETVAVGDNCVVPFYLTVLAAIMEGMPAEVRQEFGTQLKPVIDQLTQGEQSAPEPAKPRGKRQRDTGARQPVTPAGAELQLDEHPVTGDMIPVSLDEKPDNG